jgi:predicted Zn-dependent peptidase
LIDQENAEWSNGSAFDVSNMQQILQGEFFYYESLRGSLGYFGNLRAVTSNQDTLYFCSNGMSQVESDYDYLNKIKDNLLIPEPATLSLLAVGGLMALRRRR